MGHLDVWAYVILSQGAASNHTPYGWDFAHGDRSVANLLLSQQPWLGQLEPSGSWGKPLTVYLAQSQNTHTLMPCPSWPDLDLLLEKEVVLAS